MHRRHVLVPLAFSLALHFAPSASSANLQFSAFTAATNQPPAVNPAVETLEECPTCAPPTHSRELAEWGCPSCPRESSQPPSLKGDCTDCGDHGEAAMLTTDPFTTVVDTCPDCEPFELHPRVGWRIDNDRTGTGVHLNNGTLFHQQTDLDIPGRGFSFRFVRRHVSGIAYDGPLGKNWEFSYNIRVTEAGNGDVTLYDGTGRADLFVKSGSAYTTPSGRFESLAKAGTPSKFTLTKPSGTNYVFTASTGTLESITDRAGSAMTFSYDGEGRLSTVSDTLSRTITFGYDSNGRITTVTDFDSRVWTYAYTSGKLTSVTTPGVAGFTSGKTTTLAYTASDQLDTITDPKSQLILDATYTSGKVTALRYGDSGDDYSFSYDSSTVTTVTDRNGNERQVTYSSSGQPTSVVERTNRNVRAGEGDYTTSYTFNSDGMLTQVVFPDGNKAAYAYSTGSATARTNLTEETLTSSGGSPSRYSKWTYNSLGLATTFEEPRNADELDKTRYRTYYYYDSDEATLGDLNGDGVTSGSIGVLVKKVRPTATTQTPSITPVDRLRYNAYGQPTWWEHPDGEITTFSYYSTGDQKGYLQTRIEDDTTGGLQLATEWTYDKVGNIASVEDPRGYTTTYTVNDLNQVTNVNVPLSATADFDTKFEFDANDNVTKKEIENLDGDGSAYSNAWITTTWTYETLNRRATQVDEVSSTKTVTTSYSYDENRNLTLITYPVTTRKLKLEYDERDLLYKKTRGYQATVGTASTEEWTYNGNRQVTVHESGDGNETTTTYTAFDQPSTITDPVGTVLERTYDAAGNLYIEDLKDPNGNKHESTEFAWNEPGWRASMVRKYRKVLSDSFQDYLTSYQYKKDGRLAKVIGARANDTSATDDFDVAYTYLWPCQLPRDRSSRWPLPLSALAC